MCTPICSCSDPLCSVAWERVEWLIRTELRRGETLTRDQVLDLTQETLLALLSSQQPGETPEELRGLAVTIARRAKAAWLRRPANRCHRSWRDKFGDTLVTPAEDRFAEDLIEALGLLADDTRRVFVAVFIDGLSVPKAATVLGYSRYRTLRLRAEAVAFFARLWAV